MSFLTVYSVRPRCGHTRDIGRQPQPTPRRRRPRVPPARGGHAPGRRGPALASTPARSVPCFVYILRRLHTGSPSDETPWLPNKEMTKPCEVSDETSTNLFPHFQCQTLQCDTSTLNLRLGGSGPVA